MTEVVKIDELVGIRAWHVGVVKGALWAGNWATFFVRDGVRNGAAWVDVTVQSSFGTWSHHWANIGDADWRQWLASSDESYVMLKFMGAAYREEDLDATISGVRQSIVEERRGGWVSARDAREAWEATEDCEDVRDLLAHLSRTRLFRDSYWEVVRTRINPVSRAFWQSLWVPWIEAIAQEQQDNAPEPANV